MWGYCSFCTVTAHSVSELLTVWHLPWICVIVPLFFLSVSFFVALARSWCHSSACNHSLIMFIDFNIKINKTISTPFALRFWVIISRHLADFHALRNYEFAINCPSLLMSKTFLALRVCRRKKIKNKDVDKQWCSRPNLQARTY